MSGLLQSVPRCKVRRVSPSQTSRLVKTGTTGGSSVLPLIRILSGSSQVLGTKTKRGKKTGPIVNNVRLVLMKVVTGT